MKSLWGCEVPAQQAVWRDLDGNDFYTCPVQFLHPTILEWYSEVLYYKEFNAAPGRYCDLPAKWIEAYLFYKSCLDKWLDAGKPKTDKTGPLRAGLRSRRGG